jgi:hypothetical protein
MITEIEQAKQVLEANGYYVENLWSVEDVQTRFKCTDDEAQKVLNQALNSESTMEQIWFNIDYYAVEQRLIDIDEE